MVHHRMGDGADAGAEFRAADTPADDDKCCARPRVQDLDGGLADGDACVGGEAGVLLLPWVVMSSVPCSRRSRSRVRERRSSAH
ncbi:hypothetical protein ADK59_15870 [Streptomyces sp. XY332]|nr:hypothetical protein ADK59_15870 [Streptomyces sp. XY332]